MSSGLEPDAISTRPTIEIEISSLKASVATKTSQVTNNDNTQISMTEQNEGNNFFLFSYYSFLLLYTVNSRVFPSNIHFYSCYFILLSNQRES